MTNRLIAGSGRSGTTWIQDAVAEANSLRTIFEPLLLLEPAAESASLCRRLAPGQDHPECRVLWEQAFSGALRTTWTDYRVRSSRLRPSLAALRGNGALRRYVGRWHTLYRRRREYRTGLDLETVLVKSIRANLMLEWLHDNFAARIVLIVRHPAAVVESQLRTPDGDWDPLPAVRYYASQPALLSELGAGFEAVAKRQLGPYAAATFRWCVENAVALRAADAGVATVVHYEALTQHDASAWRRLAEALELANVPAQDALRKPSQQASPEFRLARERDANVPRWRSRLDSAALAEIEGVLQATDMTQYTLDSELPQPGGRGDLPAGAVPA